MPWDKPGHDGKFKAPKQHMSVRIVDVREITKPISSPIRNAYIDFTKMTTSLVAVVTDVVRDGKRWSAMASIPTAGTGRAG